MLGSYHNNQKSIEISLMRRFLDDTTILAMAQTDHVDLSNHHEILSYFLETNKRGTADETIMFNCFKSTDLLSMLNVSTCLVTPSNQFASPIPSISACPPIEYHSFYETMQECLKTCYDIFVPSVVTSSVSYMYESFANLDFWGNRIGSVKSRLEKSSVIMASWVKDHGFIDVESADTRAGVVQYFFQQHVQTEHRGYIKLIMAKVNWYQLHPQHHIL